MYKFQRRSKRMDTLSMFKDSENITDYAKGKYIFHQGEVGDNMYVILEGEVDIILNEKVIATFKPGDLVGEMALIDHSPRSASAFARTDCKVVPVDMDSFLYLVQHTPHFAVHVMEILTSKVRALDKLIAPGAFKS